MSCVSDPIPYAGSCMGTMGVPIRWESIHTGLRAATTWRHVPSCETAALLWVFVQSGKAFACAHIPAAAFSYAHASLCAWWVGLLHGFWALVNHWDCSGTVGFPIIQESIHLRVQGSRQALPELHQGAFLLLRMQQYYWLSLQPGKHSGVCTVLPGKCWG